MPATKALPQFEAFGPYVDPFGASQTAFSLWLESWRAGMDAALWWTEQWARTFSIFSPATAYASRSGPASGEVRPVAAIIDLAQAAAARTAADFSEAAGAAIEVVERTADRAVSFAEDAASVPEQAALAFAPEPDDLTRLVGVGPKLAAALAERGVTRFADIAGWTEADLAEIDRALDLKGRAVRDAWVAQAKRLAAETAPH